MVLSRASMRLCFAVLFRILIIGGIVLSLNLIAARIGHYIDFDVRPSNEDLVHDMVMSAAGAYVILLAIPFVPGAEIGMMMLAAFGPPVVLLVYLCTITGLTISYTIGRLVPFAALTRVLRFFGAKRAADLLDKLEPMNEEERLAFMMERSKSPLLPTLFRYRPIGLAVLLNIPGNVVIGGGGGLALLAGASRLFSAPIFLATIVIAVAPVPLLIHFFGQSTF